MHDRRKTLTCGVFNRLREEAPMNEWLKPVDGLMVADRLERDVEDEAIYPVDRAHKNAEARDEQRDEETAPEPELSPRMKEIE